MHAVLVAFLPLVVPIAGDPGDPTAVEAAARELALLLADTPGVLGVDLVAGSRGARLLVRIAGDPALTDSLHERFAGGFQGCTVVPVRAAFDPQATASHAPPSHGGLTYAFRAEHGWTLRTVVDPMATHEFRRLTTGHDPLVVEGRFSVRTVDGTNEILLSLDRITYWDGRVAFEVRFGRHDTAKQLARAAQIVARQAPAADDPIAAASLGEQRLALALAALHGRPHALGTEEVDTYLAALVALTRLPAEDAAVAQRRAGDRLRGSLRQIGEATEGPFAVEGLMRWDDSIQLGAGGVADVRYLEHRTLGQDGSVRSVRARLALRGREIPWRGRQRSGSLALDYTLEARVRRAE